MKKIHYFYFLLIILVLFSCHGKRLSTEHFMAIEKFSELDGKYINEDMRLSRMFNLYWHNNEIDVMDLRFVTNDSLIISYVDTMGYKTLALKGKRKENFFEYHFQNTKIYLPPIIMTSQIDRLRIGKDKDSKLMIYHWDEHQGMVFPLGAAGFKNDEYAYSFARYDKTTAEGLRIVQVNDKWGYVNDEDSIIIEPIYDYAQPFKNGIAKVARNNCWGLIDTANNIVTPLVYDFILKSECDGLRRVRRDGKWGLLNAQNELIVAPQYDQMKPFGQTFKDSLFSDLAQVYKDNKVGFINCFGEEVIPAVYDTIELPFGNDTNDTYRTCLNGKYGYVSGKGVLCNPVLDKAPKRLSYSGYSSKNKELATIIGRYAEVVYKGEPYIFAETGVLFKYKKFGLFKDYRLDVDFQSKIYIGEQ
ncbi:hypothetical protein M2132_001382 [Dysgonomonas sp. PH5-45]|uniref:WG repeat-containing protein n=1 Tax=unclassified Dysgonomonas TaxID=2630389 RepID=UPI0024734933|nr:MULTISPECIES: WG repeat-containing protein [unclassified Dysgonomonas]MDH6355045.1 hypothetical protein [Dysgonomonas sp. PH5-45]MDH6387945.1 hypothetical protein [Dysgonomonas sp. PH5-37]